MFRLTYEISKANTCEYGIDTINSVHLLPVATVVISLSLVNCRVNIFEEDTTQSAVGFLRKQLLVESDRIPRCGKSPLIMATHLDTVNMVNDNKN